MCVCVCVCVERNRERGVCVRSGRFIAQESRHIKSLMAVWYCIAMFDTHTHTHTHTWTCTHDTPIYPHTHVHAYTSSLIETGLSIL